MSGDPTERMKFRLSPDSAHHVRSFEELESLDTKHLLIDVIRILEWIHSDIMAHAVMTALAHPDERVRALGEYFEDIALALKLHTTPDKSGDNNG